MRRGGFLPPFGISARVIGLLKGYLLGEAGIRTITAHIMRENIPSAKAAKKNGFRCLYPDILEDWGLPERVLVDKYVFKRRWQVPLTRAPEKTEQ